MPTAVLGPVDRPQWKRHRPFAMAACRRAMEADVSFDIVSPLPPEVTGHDSGGVTGDEECCSPSVARCAWGDVTDGVPACHVANDDWRAPALVRRGITPLLGS